MAGAPEKGTRSPGGSGPGVDRDEYRQTDIYDDAKFERYVRSHLRKIAKMTKANEGFEKTLRYQ